MTTTNIHCGRHDKIFNEETPCPGCETEKAEAEKKHGEEGHEHKEGDEEEPPRKKGPPKKGPPPKRVEEAPPLFRKPSPTHKKKGH